MPRTAISHDVSLKSVIDEGFGVIHHPWTSAHITQNEDDDGTLQGRLFKIPAREEPQRSQDYKRKQETRCPFP